MARSIFEIARDVVIKPLGDRLAVSIEVHRKTPGGIILADDQKSRVGRVLAIGPEVNAGVVLIDQFVFMPREVGDEFTDGDRHIVVIPISYVTAIIEKREDCGDTTCSEAPTIEEAKSPGLPLPVKPDKVPVNVDLSKDPAWRAKDHTGI